MSPGMSWDEQYVPVYQISRVALGHLKAHEIDISVAVLRTLPYIRVNHRLIKTEM
jgi:hypothetical protein